MYKVEFKYEPGQKVIDPVGNVGCILACMTTIDGQAYRVQAGQVIENYTESMLRSCPAELAENRETKG